MTAVSARPRACSVARTLEIVGEKWAILAVREVFLGNRRFDEMIRRTGAPRDTLAARLRTLVDAGILERREYSTHPARFEYRLTEAGRELYPVILTLMRWGDRHLAGRTGRRWSLSTAAVNGLSPRWYVRHAVSPLTRATPGRWRRPASEAQGGPGLSSSRRGPPRTRSLPVRARRWYARPRPESGSGPCRLARPDS